jgi:5-formyltetrahydrofolate cyclo-ligase
MTKEELRNVYKQKRQQLSDDLKLHYDQTIVQRLKPFLKEDKHIALFLPILRQKEIDLSPLLDEKNQHFYSSKAEFGSGQMDFFPLKSDSDIVVSDWGIPEPVSSTPVDPTFLDVIIVPLLICDDKGNRVGYGKGFYDRFLARCSPNSIKVGVNYFPPVSTIQDAYEGDIPLDILITPTENFQFNEK